MKRSLLAFAFACFIASAAHGDIIISEVHPSGSGNGTYAADWFELTNTGPTTVNIAGWKMDDNSNSSGLAVALNGVSSINAGQSVVFIETSSAATVTAFNTAWFGGSVPAGFTAGTYSGSGVGLSTTTDAVNIFDSSNALVTRIDFGAASSAFTFDNAAGLNNVTISTLSSVGVNGAFLSANISETGSPGRIAAVPEPASLSIMGLSVGTLLMLRRRSAQAAGKH